MKLIDETSGGKPESLPVEASFQRTLIPLDVITSYANNLGSADLKNIVEARDGRHYAVKTINDGNGKVPASELFCYELAYRVIIPTPPYSLIKMPSGDLAFGSLWEGGVVNGNPNINFFGFIDGVLKGTVKITNLKAFLSRLYAFDLFVNNLDRHWGNYLWRSSYGDSMIALAFDFSRACFEVGHAGFEALQSNMNTQIVFEMINLNNHYDRAEAAACLERIRTIPTEEIASILDGLPQNWMSKKDKNGYIDWWNSQARLDRIDTLLTRI
jgi:hypothetical protein